MTATITPVPPTLLIDPLCLTLSGEALARLNQCRQALQNHDREQHQSLLGKTNPGEFAMPTPRIEETFERANQSRLAAVPRPRRPCGSLANAKRVAHLETLQSC